jgi:hypothetical protein
VPRTVPIGSLWLPWFVYRDDPEHHVALVFTDTAEDAIAGVFNALEVWGEYDFFEAWPFPPRAPR